MKTTVYGKYRSKNLVFTHLLKHNPQPEEFPPHFHDVYELIFFKSGEISYTVGGKKYKLKKNMLILTRPGDMHRIIIDKSTEYERYAILFDEKLIPFDIYERIPKDLDVISFTASQTVSEIFNNMDFYFKKLSRSDFRNILPQLISEIFYNIIIETEKQKRYDYILTNQLIHRALIYIEENLITVKGIEEICDELYITKSHLHHLFKKHLKTTPKKYITIKRLSLARREIYSGAKASEVYLKCGFSDYSAFFRAYKNQFGISPSDISDTGYSGLEDISLHYWE